MALASDLRTVWVPPSACQSWPDRGKWKQLEAVLIEEPMR
jgi:hypothetical protein